MFKKSKAWQIDNLGGLSLYSLSEFIANMSGWVFSALALRSLSIEVFGDLSFWISLTYLFTLLTASLRITVNKFFAESNNKTQGKMYSELGSLSLKLGGFSLVLGLIVLMTKSLWVVSFSFSGGYGVLLLLLFQIVFMFLVAWTNGLLLATKRFNLAAGVLIAEVILRIGLTVWAFSNPSLTNFLLSIVMPTMVSGVWMLYSQKSNLQKWNNFQEKISNKLAKFYTQTTFFRIGVMLMLTADFLLAKWFLPAADAGVYALLVIAGKAIIFLSQTFYTILTPLVSPYLGDVKKSSKLALLFIGLFVVAAMLIMFFLVQFPEYTLGLMMGDKYLVIMDYLSIYLISVTLLSVVMLVSMFQILMEKYRITQIIFFGLFLEIVLIWLRHDSIGMVINNVFISSLVTMTLVLIWIRQSSVKKVEAVDSSS